jgi:biotin transporter BioY
MFILIYAILSILIAAWLTTAAIDKRIKDGDKGSSLFIIGAFVVYLCLWPILVIIAGYQHFKENEKSNPNVS